MGGWGEERYKRYETSLRGSTTGKQDFQEEKTGREKSQ